VRDRLQHGLRGERQFLRHEVGDHVGPSPHVLPSLVVVVRAVDLQLKPLSINVRQKRLVWVPNRCDNMYKARARQPFTACCTCCAHQLLPRLRHYGIYSVVVTRYCYLSSPVVKLCYVVNVATKNVRCAQTFFRYENPHSTASVPVRMLLRCAPQKMWLLKYFFVPRSFDITIPRKFRLRNVRMNL